MAELTNLITVEKGTNAIFKDNTWSWGWSAVVGYESNRFRIERYKFVVPEKDGDGKPVVKVDSIGFNFGKSENFPVGGGSGVPSYIISNDAELKGFNPGSSKVTNSDIYAEGSPEIPDDGYLTIEIPTGDLDPLSPGTYYLFIYYNSATYFWRHWNGHTAPSCVCSYTSYTKCLPPKDFTAPARFAPGGQAIELTWNSNNLDGIANKATGFEIQYDFSSEYLNANTITTGMVENYTLNINATNEQRGKILYIKIRTIGSVEDYKSDWVYTESRVNTQPTIPSVKLPQTYTGTRVYQLTQFDLRATDCEGKELQDFYYSLDNENYTKYAEEGIDFSNFFGEQTINFKAWDGVEYSDPKSFIVFVVSASNPELKITNESHFLTVTADFSGIEEKNYPDNIRIALLGEHNVLIGQTVRFSRTINENNMNICANYDLFALLKNNTLTEGFKYKVRVYFYIDYATNKYLEFSQDSDEKTILLFNSPGPMYSEVEINLKDLMNRTPVSIAVSGDIVKSYNHQNGTLVIQTEPKKNPINPYSTMVTATYSHGVKIWKVFNEDYIVHPRISDQVPSNTSSIEINAFKEETTTRIIDINPKTLGGYDKAALCIDDIEAKLNLTEHGSSNEDNLRYVFDYEEVRKWLVTNVYTNFAEYYDIKKVTVRLCMYKDNSDLKTQYSLPFDIALNFAKAPEACQIISLSPKLEGNNCYIQEGGTAEVTLTINPYSYQNIYARLVYLEEKEWRRLGDIVTIIPQGAGSYGSFEGENAIPRAGALTGDFTFQNFLQIESSFETLFLEVSIDKTTWVRASGFTDFQVIAHKPPSIVIKSGKITRENGNKYISLEADFNSGYSLPVKALENVEVELDIKNWLYNQNGNSLSEVDGNSFKYVIEDDSTIFTVRVEYTTEIFQRVTVDGKQYNITSSKTTYSNYFTIYDEAPTVSYRPNQVAINTATIGSTEKESAFIVTGATGKNLVSFVGTNGRAYIDLNTRGLYNFVIDCGSWDGTSGGIIPSNPDTPTGLARVAYTGQIGHLLEGEYEIVFNGGDSGVENTE